MVEWIGCVGAGDGLGPVSGVFFGPGPYGVGRRSRPWRHPHRVRARGLQAPCRPGPLTRRSRPWRRPHRVRARGLQVPCRPGPLTRRSACDICGLRNSAINDSPKSLALTPADVRRLGLKFPIANFKSSLLTSAPTGVSERLFGESFMAESHTPPTTADEVRLKPFAFLPIRQERAGGLRRCRGGRLPPARSVTSRGTLFPSALVSAIKAPRTSASHQLFHDHTNTRPRHPGGRTALGQPAIHLRNPMKRRLRCARDKGATIAAFGQARLVRQTDGRHELIAGTAEDAADARDWCSLFAHEIVFSPAPQPRPAPRQRRRPPAGRAVTIARAGSAQAARTAAAEQAFYEPANA